MSGGRGSGPSRRSDYRVIVTNLPASGSWQDLKDHMREAGDVGFADVFKDGSGVVEFLRYEDMKYALKKLDDSKFRSHEVDSVCLADSCRVKLRTFVYAKNANILVQSRGLALTHHIEAGIQTVVLVPGHQVTGTKDCYSRNFLILSPTF